MAVEQRYDSEGRLKQKAVLIEHTCIYCKGRKNADDFDKDHVVPVSFGRFKGGLTLLNSVCRQCNNYFSRELELFLARDSLWGLMRFRYGLKAFEADKWIYSSRVRLVLDDPGLGDWNGAIVEVVPPRNRSESNPEIILVPQVAFKKKGENIWKNFPIDQIRSQEDLLAQNFDLTKCKLVGNSESDIEKVKEKLSQLGIDTSLLKELSDEKSNPAMLGRLRVSVSSRIDAIILRSVAKIAFNYLAKIQGTDFIIRQQFDNMRDFIRYGKNQDKGLVTVVVVPLLRDKKYPHKRMRAHIIIIRWGDQSLSRIIGQVSLFNYLTFNMVLCSSSPGIIRPLNCGHFYNLANNEVIELKPHRLTL